MALHHGQKIGKKNNWKNASKKDVKNKDLWIELDQLTSKHNVKWTWVKGHSGHEKNEIADILANKGIDNLQRWQKNILFQIQKLQDWKLNKAIV